MKKRLSLPCVMVCMLFFALSAWAQIPQKLVNVIVSPNHSSWQYKTGEEAVFDIQVLQNENLVKDVVVDYELGPECFPTKTAKDVVLKDGKLTLKSSMKTPGFLRCKVIAKVNGKTYPGLATAGYDVEKIQPTSQNPSDFDAFWSKALTDARNTPLDAKMTLLPERCTSNLNFYEVNFAQYNPNCRMYGILTVPKKPGKYPAVLEVPGAGIRPYWGSSYGDDVISLTVGIHGIPVTLPQVVYDNLAAGALTGYNGINKNDKDKFYYKRVYTGCARAIDFIYSLPEFDGKNVGVTGGSQGGALSITTAALEPRIKFLAANYPAICDYAGYLNGRAGGWPHYFRNAKPVTNEVETLAYFDVVNFARRLNVPVLMCFGYNDETCPPTSMYSAYNVIPSQKELHLFLETGHWTYPEETDLRRGWVHQQCYK